MGAIDFFPCFRACFDDARLPPQARMLLLALLRTVNNATGLATPSARRLCTLTGLPRSTVYEQRVVLIQLGYISVRERRDDGGQLSSEYALTFGTVVGALDQGDELRTEAAEVRQDEAPVRADALTPARTPNNAAATPPRGGNRQGAPVVHNPPTAAALPPPSAYRTPPSVPRTLPSTARTPPSAGPDAPPSAGPDAPRPAAGHISLPPESSPSELPTGERGERDALSVWKSFREVYEERRTATYGDAGAPSRVSAEQQAIIVEGVAHVMARGSAHVVDASRAVVDTWFKRFPGKNDALRARNHPLRYLADDIGDVSVMAVRLLAEKAEKAKPLAKAAHEPRQPRRVAAATPAELEEQRENAKRALAAIKG